MADDLAQGLDALTMAHGDVQLVLLGPAAVAVHDDGHMAGELLKILAHHFGGAAGFAIKNTHMSSKKAGTQPLAEAHASAGGLLSFRVAVREGADGQLPFARADDPQRALTGAGSVLPLAAGGAGNKHRGFSAPGAGGVKRLFQRQTQQGRPICHGNQTSMISFSLAAATVSMSLMALSVSFWASSSALR